MLANDNDMTVRGGESGAMTLLFRLLRIPRDIQSRAMFRAIREHCRGDVLDVGGWDFFLTARAMKGVAFDRWTTLECSKDKLLTYDDPRYTCVLGDGCAMTMFKDASFDTILNLQVLEHVVEPNAMMREVARVLRSGGNAIFLIPQTGYMHMAPDHYYNFTRFWIQQQCELNNLDILSLHPIGGHWASVAMHSIFFFFQSFRLPGFSTPGCRRRLGFYVLWPFMALTALCLIPIGFVFSAFGDLTEAANNHLVVARKR